MRLDIGHIDAKRRPWIRDTFARQVADTRRGTGEGQGEDIHPERPIRAKTTSHKPIYTYQSPRVQQNKIINKSADEPLPKRPPAARRAVSAHTSGRRGRLLAGRREQGGAGYFMARRTPSASGVGVGPAAVVIAPFNFRGSLIDGEVNEDNRILKL